MGFFSSSKPSSSDHQEPTKSRWFSSKSSSRSSTSKTAPTQARSAAQAQLPSPAAPSARFPTPPSHQQPLRLLPTLLPPESSDGSGHGAGDRSRVGEASGSGSVYATRRAADQSAAPPSRKGKGREDDATVLLANRLNELAVSNADGLLGDEDYRILRQEIFEQMSAAREQARVEARNAAVSGGSEMVNREDLRTPTPGRHPDRPPSAHSSQSGRSRLSNLGSLFSQKQSGYDLRSNRDSNVSGGGGGSSLRASRLRSNGGSVGDSSSLFSNGRSQRTSQDHGSGGASNRARQNSMAESGGMSVRSGRTSYNSSIHSTTAEGSRTGSIFSTATRNGSLSGTTPPPSAYALRALHAGGADSLPGADSTPAQLRAELADVEAEGQRLLAVFDELRAKARADCGDHQVTPTPTSLILESPLGDVAGEWEIIQHSPSLGSVGKFAGPNGGLKPALKKTSYSTPLSAIANGQQQQYLRGRDSLSSLSSLPASLQRRPSDGRTALSERPMLPPSFRGTSANPEQAALQARLADVERRRHDVQDRYERRLEFLRGKLRAAQIRERALR